METLKLKNSLKFANLFLKIVKNGDLRKMHFYLKSKIIR